VTKKLNCNIFLIVIKVFLFQAYQSSSTEDVRLRHSKVCESVLVKKS